MIPMPPSPKHPDPTLNEELAWQLHQEVRELAYKHVQQADAANPAKQLANMTHALKRFMEQVSGVPETVAATSYEPYPYVKAHILGGKQ